MTSGAQSEPKAALKWLCAAFLAAAMFLSVFQPAFCQGWVKKTFGPITFEIPSDWKLLMDDVATQKIWFKGEQDKPDVVFSVTTSEIDDILGGLKIESKAAVTVGGKRAVSHTGTPKEEKGKGIVIVFDTKEIGGGALALACAFPSDESLRLYKGVIDRILGSVAFAGGAEAVGCQWDSFTNDPRQFATQPGGVFPLRRNYKSGKYRILVGPAGKDGLAVPPAKWRTFGPVEIEAGNKYVGIIHSGKAAGTICELFWERNASRLDMYSKPPIDQPGLPGHAVVYVRNEAGDQWYAICLDPVVSGAATPPICQWDSFTNDPRQFAAQPGGVFPLRRNYRKGEYRIHIGPAGKDGLAVPPAKWRTFGPVKIEAGNKYCGIIRSGQGTLCELLWEINSVRLETYSKPPVDQPGLPGHAVVYVRNEAGDQWYAICLEPVVSAGGAAGLDFDTSVLQRIKSGQPHTLKARVHHIPPDVAKLKVSWYLHLNECVSADPPGNKANFWYIQMVDVRNGSAEFSIVMKAESEKKGSSFALSVQDEPYNKKVFLRTSIINYEIK